MPKKSGFQSDASSGNFDFSKDNLDFKERLRKEFLRAANQSQVTLLSDDDCSGLNAAGAEILHLIKKKGGNLE